MVSRTHGRLLLDIESREYASISIYKKVTDINIKQSKPVRYEGKLEHIAIVWKNLIQNKKYLSDDRYAQ